MITLYRTAQDPTGSAIQAALEELVVAHKVEIAPRALDATAVVPSLPAIVDGDRVIFGDDALRAYVDELVEWMGEWRKYQADACYIDDEGENC